MFRCAKLLIICQNAHQQNMYSMFFNKYFSNSKFANGEDLFNRSELRFAPIFAFLTAQNCELNARRNLWLEIIEFCACRCYVAYTQTIVTIANGSVQEKRMKKASI